MARVYVYSWDNTDYSTIGECGALDAISCTFEEVGNGMSEISLMHPIDQLGKYTFLRTGAMLKVNVPVRTTPEIENGAFVTQVETWVVKQTATKQQRYVYSKKEGGRKTKTLKLGAEVVVTSKPADSERWKIKSGKVSGWIASSGLERSVEIIVPDNAAGIEKAAPAWESREQLFRIYKVEKADDGISCSARHPMYDLLQNMTTYDTNGETTLQQSGDAILNNCIDPHDFRFYTDITGTQTGAHYVDADPVSAFLNPENGLAAAWNAQLVRDNFDIFLLANAGMDRGTRIEYARNMLGVQMEEDIDSTATAIRPIGQKKDGKPLYLDGDGLVVSRYADQYPFKRIYKLECTDCTVGTNGVTEAIAKARMLEQAEKLLADGVDMPNVSVRVTFASLGYTVRYAQYRNLENVFLYDTVAVANPRLQINVKTQVIRIMWDCLREKMVSVELGSLQALSPSVAGWQISGGISGGKLIQGSVGAAQLGSEAISSRHIQAESVNTEALQAGSITSEKLAAGSVTAEKIETGALESVSIEAITAHIEKIVAGQITTDALYAALGKFDVLNAGTGYFDKATIQHLVSSALNLDFGVGNEVFIKNLKVIYAQMVSAAIGNLVIKASDGKYYEIDVDADGRVTASLSTVTDGEISAGMTDAGKVILGTEITAESLNTANLLATYALVNKIDAARIDVDQLFAREAFIALLRTTKIVGDMSITIMAQGIDANAAAIAQQNKDLANAVTKLEGDISDIQSQVDGSITTWYYDGEPTLENEPAVNWNTDDLKEAHQGDLYYDKTNGYSYRWLKEGTIWKWVRITDTDISEALATAAKAKDTADAKKRIFYTQPKPPYDAGDLWVQGSDGDILVCIYPKLAEFSFAQSDWEIASKYTDDTKANEAKDAADAAQSAADAAQESANNAGNAASEAVKSIGDIPNKVVVAPDGLYLKDQNDASVLKINSASVSIGTTANSAADGYSQFTASYVQFGNYQLRKSSDGGLVFKLKG